MSAPRPVLQGESGGRYRLDPEPLAVGGQGIVYRAVAEDDDHPVAIKVAQHPGAEGDWLIAYAHRIEALAADPIVGPLLVPVWDVGRWDDRPFLVMELVPESLDGWASRQPLEARMLAAQRLVGAIRVLHRVPLVHADLKPGNVLVRDDGDGPVLQLADLGPSAWMTPGFAPPEQLAGGRPDPAWDRFALAATVWALLCGTAPTGPLALASAITPAAAASLARGVPIAPSRAFRSQVVAVSAEDRAAFDRGAPDLTSVRLALEGLLAPDARRRAPTLDPLWEALHGRVPARGRRGALVGIGLVAGGLLLATVRAPDPTTCPAGFTADGIACAASDGRRLVLVPPGRFTMGGSEGDAEWTGDATTREVVLTRGFWLGEAEVTQAEWERITGEDPVGTRTADLNAELTAPCREWLGRDLRGPDLPVVCVTWFDAIAFLNTMSERDGLTPAYSDIAGERVGFDPDADGWRLPTEAEWEWAARGGVPGPWGGAGEREGLCAYGNVRDASALEKWTGELACSDGQPVLAPARSFQPNPLGLFDLHGNALEWVWDRYGPYEDLPTIDPRGSETGTLRTLRGASWNHVAKGVAARYATDPAGFNNVMGLRVARNAQ